MDMLPFDMNVCPAREVGMDHHQAPSITLKERMRVCEKAHHLARSGFHGAGVEAEAESMLDGPPDLLRVGEDVVAPGFAALEIAWSGVS
jgi:hypothetical protein